jgi:hypothetical protein
VVWWQMRGKLYLSPKKKDSYKCVAYIKSQNAIT